MVENQLSQLATQGEETTKVTHENACLNKLVLRLTEDTKVLSKENEALTQSSESKLNQTTSENNNLKNNILKLEEENDKLKLKFDQFETSDMDLNEAMNEITYLQNHLLTLQDKLNSVEKEEQKLAGVLQETEAKNESLRETKWRPKRSHK
ncbi:hypothetical protein SNE40_002977 [Patella caerulea]|uniref:Uncharacterized protein n=1 Tax=Patella caerulea TaxID=87958 RepID=A0AAN8QEN8_PATCE